MTDLVKRCIEATGRKYPAGYGFALTYLTSNPGPDHFKAMRDQALAACIRDAKAGCPDGWEFLRAYSDSQSTKPVKGWAWWLIEAAQVVLGDAMAGNAKSAEVLRVWDHPGY